VLAISRTDVPGRLENLNRAQAHMADGSLVAIEMESTWRHKEFWVLKFAGVDSIAAAERFRGADVCVPAEDRGQLPAGEHFQSDLIGCEVIDGASGQPIGRVGGWQEYGGPLLMAVDCAGREVLIPFVPAICKEVDVAGRRIIADLPEGLLELE
jgi:16S rRNA processing protein RimM